MDAVKVGGDRQVLHEVIRENAMRAWEAIAAGDGNPLARFLADDVELTQYVDPAEIRSRLDPTKHVGDAPERALRLADCIEGQLENDRP